MATADGLIVARMRTLAVLAVLAAATALIPMVATMAWFVQLAVVLVVGAIVNILVTVLWRAGFGSLAGLSAAFVTIGAIYARDDFLGGVIPTPTSVSTLVELLNGGAGTIWALEAPLPASAGLNALMVTGLCLAWWCADALMGATQSPALAGVPLLAILLPAAALSDGGVTGWSFALAAAGYLTVMLGSQVVRVQEWGQLVPPGRARPGWGLDGVVVTAAAVAVALFVPTLIPGLNTRLVPQRADGATIAVLNPMLDLHDNLTSQGNAVMLRYETTAPAPEPLRVVADDDFNGRMWQPTYGTLDRTDQVQRGLPRAPGLAPEVPTVPATTTVTIDSLRQTWLPSPYPPTRIEVEGDWLFDRTTLGIVGDDVRTERDLRYTVSHDLVTPTPEQLQASSPSAEAQQWTALPPGMPPSIQETAEQVAGSGSSYEQALRLQAWLRSSGEFTYSEDAPPETGSGAIVDFLTRRSGYCVHFASTMAVMARTLGIPARVAVGFQPGRQLSDGSYEVRQRDAHAWPELYFSGIGWVRFEPTPATQVPTPPPWTASVEPATPAPAPTPEPTQATPTTSPTPAPAAGSDQGLGNRVLAWFREISWPWLLVVMLALAALVTPWLSARRLRRVRWRSARSPADAVEAAWAELLDDLEDLGVRRVPAATVREVQATVEELLQQDARQHLLRLADDVETARYSPLGAGVVATHRPVGRDVGGAPGVTMVDRPTVADAGAVDHGLDVSAVVAAVRAVQTPGLRHRLFPRTGLRRLRQQRDKVLDWLTHPTFRRGH